MTGNTVIGLVLGGTGFLGSRLLATDPVAYRAAQTPRVRTASDLKELSASCSNGLAQHPGAALVNCIGLREGSNADLNLVNADVPNVIAAVAKKHGVPFVQLASAAETARYLDTETVAESGLVSGGLPPYGGSKLAGTHACLSYELGTAVRIYNLHGLPHQPSSGLHRVCEAVNANTRRQSIPLLYDTQRDYVNVTTAVDAIDRAVRDPCPGLVEVCSGIGVFVHEIVADLPDDVRDTLHPHIVTPDLITEVVGTVNGKRLTDHHKTDLVELLANEVTACAATTERMARL